VPTGIQQEKQASSASALRGLKRNAQSASKAPQQAQPPHRVTKILERKRRK
jgi:hypothetical protein